MHDEIPLVSVIMPYCQEWPQIAFTIRAVHEELRDIPHEIIAVDNFCAQALDQMHNVWKKTGVPKYIDEGHDRPNDKTKEPPPLEWFSDLLGERLEAFSESRLKLRLPWLKWVRYADKLSHWNAKNRGVAISRGRLLLFLDAHVVPSRGSLSNMAAVYDDCTSEHGPCSLHLPLTYHILEEHRLIYKLVHNPDRGEIHYSFTGYPLSWDAAAAYHEVPCMSCCGVMISREVYRALGGWPTAMGIYGGGENFLNFTMAVLGMKHFIKAGAPLHHYATHRGRGYHYEWGDHKRNQAAAAYMYGDREKLIEYCLRHPNYSRVPQFFDTLIEFIPSVCSEHRTYIKQQQKLEIDQWLARWIVKTF